MKKGHFNFVKLEKIGFKVKKKNVVLYISNNCCTIIIAIKYCQIYIKTEQKTMKCDIFSCLSWPQMCQIASPVT